MNVKFERKRPIIKSEIGQQRKNIINIIQDSIRKVYNSLSLKKCYI